MGGIPAQIDSIRTLTEQADRSLQMEGWNMIRNHPDFEGLLPADQDSIRASALGLIAGPGARPEEQIIAATTIAGGGEPQDKYNRMLRARNSNIEELRKISEEVATDAVIHQREKDIIYNQGKFKIFRHYKEKISSANSLQEIDDLRDEIDNELIGTHFEDVIAHLNNFTQDKRNEIQQETNRTNIENGNYGNYDYTPPGGARTRVEFNTPIVEVNDIDLLERRHDALYNLVIDNVINLQQGLNIETAIQNQVANITLTNLRNEGIDGDLTQFHSYHQVIIDRHTAGLLSNENRAQLEDNFNTLRDQIENSIRQEIERRWQEVQNLPAHSMRDTEIQRLLTEIKNRHNNAILTPAPPAGLGIDIDRIYNSISHDTDAASASINTYLEINPNANFQAYILQLEARPNAQQIIQDYGGREELGRIFARNTSPQARTEYIRTIAREAQKQGLTPAQMDDYLKQAGFTTDGTIAGAVRPEYKDIADRAYNQEANVRIERNKTQALDAFNKSLDWNNLPASVRDDYLNTNPAQLENLLRAQGMNDAEIRDALNAVRTDQVFEDGLIGQNVVDPRTGATDFSGIRRDIAAMRGGALTENQADLLGLRINELEAAIATRVGTMERIGGWLGMNLRDIDGLKELFMNARYVVPTIKWAIIMTILVGAGTGIPALMDLPGSIVLAGGATGLAIGLVPTAKLINNFGEITRDNMRVRTAMAERRVARDELNELASVTMGALDQLEANGTLSIDQLQPNQQDVLRKFGIVRGQMLDINNIVETLDLAGRSYEQSVERLQSTFDNHRNQIRQNRGTQSGAGARYNIPSNLLSARR